MIITYRIFFFPHITLVELSFHITVVKNIILMLVLEEKQEDQDKFKCLFSWNLECLYNNSWQSMELLLRY